MLKVVRSETRPDFGGADRNSVVGFGRKWAFYRMLRHKGTYLDKGFCCKSPRGMKRHSNNRVAKAFVAVFASTPSQRCDLGRVNLCPCGLLQQNPMSRCVPSCCCPLVPLNMEIGLWREDYHIRPQPERRLRFVCHYSCAHRRQQVCQTCQGWSFRNKLLQQLRMA